MELIILKIKIYIYDYLEISLDRFEFFSKATSVHKTIS